MPSGDPLPENGRGTEVLGALADAWGYDRTRGGKWVWFRLRQRIHSSIPATTRRSETRPA